MDISKYYVTTMNYSVTTLKVIASMHTLGIKVKNVSLDPPMSPESLMAQLL